MSRCHRSVGKLRPGFSLVELLLVLSLLVMLTSLTLPGVVRWQNGIGIERALSLLQVQLQETRLSAIRTGEPWTLLLPGSDHPGKRYRRTAQNNNNVDQRHQFHWPAGVTSSLSVLQHSNITITCYPDGTVSACRLQLQDTHGQRILLQIERLTGTASVITNPLQTTATAGRTIWDPISLEKNFASLQSFGILL